MQDRELVFGWIKDFVRDYKRLHKTETSWGIPICGVADAKDHLFAELKTIIGSWHLLPSEILPQAKSVVVFFIPLAHDIVNSNIQGEESSLEWDTAYLETNLLISRLVDNVCSKIHRYGYKAVKIPANVNNDNEDNNIDPLLTSCWSQRSSAYIAGIGKFGINNMIITEQGCCGRIGSFVTELQLPPTERKSGEYCLYKLDRSCAECIKRCPCNALYIKDNKVCYDKISCKNQIYDKLIRNLPLGLADTCGKCKVSLPCSFKNPSIDK